MAECEGGGSARASHLRHHSLLPLPRHFPLFIVLQLNLAGLGRRSHAMDVPVQGLVIGELGDIDVVKDPHHLLLLRLFIVLLWESLLTASHGS